MYTLTVNSFFPFRGRSCCAQPFPIPGAHVQLYVSHSGGNPPESQGEKVMNAEEFANWEVGLFEVTAAEFPAPLLG